MEFENISVGIDIEDIERFDGKDNAFLTRIFTPLEIEYCSSKPNPKQHIAVRFCAKEAIFKALSAFGESGIEFKKIEIYHNKEVPNVRFLSDLDKKYKAKLSLSHDKTKAIAYVIVFKQTEQGERK